MIDITENNRKCFIVTAAPGLVAKVDKNIRLIGQYTMESGEVVTEESVAIYGDKDMKNALRASFIQGEESVLFVDPNSKICSLVFKDKAQKYAGQIRSTMKKPDCDHSFDPMTETYYYCK